MGGILNLVVPGGMLLLGNVLLLWAFCLHAEEQYAVFVTIK